VMSFETAHTSGPAGSPPSDQASRQQAEDGQGEDGRLGDNLHGLHVGLDLRLTQDPLPSLQLVHESEIGATGNIAAADSGRAGQ